MITEFMTFVLGTVVGCIFGVAAMSTTIKDDCDQMHMFRSGGSVYMCEVKS